MTKPKENALTIANDLIPRVSIAREGLKQTLILGANWLLDALLLQTVLKRTKIKEGWLKSGLRSGASICGRVSGWLALFSAFYYRDPERLGLGVDNDFLYAPADGKVLSIEEVDEPNFLGQRALKITIGSNLLNVHILCAPHSGRINYILSEQNVAGYTNHIGLTDDNGHKLLLGKIRPRNSTLKLPRFLTSPQQNALRLKAGQQIQQKDKIGVAALGWQTLFSICIPVEERFELLVRNGQHVQAAMTVMAHFI